MQEIALKQKIKKGKKLVRGDDEYGFELEDFKLPEEEKKDEEPEQQLDPVTAKKVKAVTRRIFGRFLRNNKTNIVKKEATMDAIDEVQDEDDQFDEDQEESAEVEESEEYYDEEEEAYEVYIPDGQREND